MFKPLSDLLGDSVRKRGLGSQVQAAMVLEFFKTVTSGYFDAEAMKAMRALYLKDHVLVVAVLSPVIAQELKLREREIVEAINKKAGSSVVRSLRFLA